WYVGQKPVGFTYRFSFIIIFWILLLAAKELTSFDLKKKQLLLASGIYFVVGLVVTVLRLHYGKYDMYMLVSLGLIILFSLLLYFSDHKSFRFVLVMVGVVEIAISSYLMLDRRSEERRVGKECRSRWVQY